jgi:hypothetical protein
MKLFLHSKIFRLFLIVVFLKLVLTNESSAVTNQPNVNNIRFEQVNDRIIITYDLSGIPEQRYDVTLMLQKKNDPAFHFVPKSISGKIGNELVCGENLQAEWKYAEEFPDGIQNGEYYFVGYASEEQETSISPWIWIGAALIVGGIVFLLANKAKDETPGEFPLPPGRP